MVKEDEIGSRMNGCWITYWIQNWMIGTEKHSEVACSQKEKEWRLNSKQIHGAKICSEEGEDREIHGWKKLTRHWKKRENEKFKEQKLLYEAGNIFSGNNK